MLYTIENYSLDSYTLSEGIVLIKMWILYALLSAFFSSITQIMAKISVNQANPSLANAIRLISVLGTAWIMVFFTGGHKDIGSLTPKALWIFGISGVITGVAWFFFYKAMDLGDASKVVSVEKLSVVITFIIAFIFLKEEMTKKIIAGCILITAGILCLL